MMFRPFLAFLSSVFMILGFVACQESNKDLADRGSRLLNLPVVLWAYNSDQCVNQQLEGLYNSFNNLSDDEKEHFKASLRNTVDAVVINATRTLGNISGDYFSLELVEKRCRRNVDRCYDTTAAKTIDRRVAQTITQLFPSAELEVNDRVLYITPQSAVDTSSTYSIWLTDRTTFNAIDASSLNTQQNIPSAVRLRRVERPELNCGPALSSRAIVRALRLSTPAVAAQQVQP